MENNNPDLSYRLTTFFKSSLFWRPFIGITGGAIIGFLYFYFVGCKTGSCSITSNPVNSIIFGALFGFFIAGTNSKKNTK
ncbi:MAG TPA: DUF6132 family protein [Bacteroidales bacterium]|nr:DUF6132 family protein [Bacteroidales bacterium]